MSGCPIAPHPKLLSASGPDMTLFEHPVERIVEMAGNTGGRRWF
jgi:hypothetical protein